jgi:hypothetical protein
MGDQRAQPNNPNNPNKSNNTDVRNNPAHCVGDGAEFDGSADELSQALGTPHEHLITYIKLVLCRKFCL